MHTVPVPARLGALTLVAVVAGTGLVGTGLVGADRALSEDVPRCERFAAESVARTAVVTGSGPTVAVIGDSWSVGLGLDDVARSWPGRLPGRVHVFGFSGSGFSAGAGACPGVSFSTRADEALATDPDLVVVQGGLNDHREPDAAVVDGVRRLLAALQGREVLLVGPARAPSRAKGAERVDGLLAEVAADGGVDHLSTDGLSLDYLGDDLHLTVAGHRELGDAVAAAVRLSRRR